MGLGIEKKCIAIACAYRGAKARKTGEALSVK